MTTMDWINLAALPVGIGMMLVITWASGRAAAYLRAKTGTEKEMAHNARLARLADGIGRIAGDVAGKLQGLPPGSNLAAVKAEAISAGVADAKTRFADTITSLGGASDATLAGMIAGEVGKLTAPAATAAAVAAPRAA